MIDSAGWVNVSQTEFAAQNSKDSPRHEHITGARPKVVNDSPPKFSNNVLKESILYDRKSPKENKKEIPQKRETYQWKFREEKLRAANPRRRLFENQRSLEGSDRSSSVESLAHRLQDMSFAGEERQSRVSSLSPPRRVRNRELDILQALRSMQPREVIPPSPFDVEDSITMTKFLKSYDRYFESRFIGTDKEKSAYLSKFLKGTAKNVYLSINGASMRFSRLQTTLEKWYEGQKSDSFDELQRRFSHCQMQEGDTVTIYCLRLESLAQRAFRESSRECERQLIRRFELTAPEKLVRQINDARGLLSVIGQDKLTWDKIKAFAEEFDRRRHSITEKVQFKPRTEDISLFTTQVDTKNTLPERYKERDYSSYKRGGFSNQRFAVNRSNNGRGFHHQPQEQRGYSHPRGRHPAGSRGIRRPAGNAMRRPQTGRPHCSWSGRTGHEIDQCWERQGACMACGDRSHSASDCDQARGGQQKTDLTCPMCSGNHLGKYCDRLDENYNNNDKLN